MQKYSQLLQITQLPLEKVNQLAINQDHAVWRSLLKVQSSRKNTDHLQAIKDLRLARSQIIQFMRNTMSQKNQSIYQKVMVCILANLVNRQFGAKRYKEGMEFFKQLMNMLKDNIQSLRQALNIIFGVTSLVALKNYNLQSNFQFKFPPNAQVVFFYIVGKVKLVSKKNQQALEAFKKILMLIKSYNPGPDILVRVYDSLSDLDQKKYQSEYQKYLKTVSPAQQLKLQQKINSELILTQLIEKQEAIIKKSTKYYPAQHKVSKKMFQLYLLKLIRQNENNQDQNFCQSMYKILKAFQTQKNAQTIKAILQQSKLAKQALNCYNDKFQSLAKIYLQYYFRKLKKQDPSTIKKQSLVNKSEIKAETIKKSSQKSKVKNITLPKAPKDTERAVQILKKCKQGCNISKINLGNSSVVQKFARIQEKKFTWGDSQKQIQFSSSGCKWKNVIAVMYGKVSDNLAKSKHNGLQAWRCFSLLTQDRSYDFYCESETDIFFWLQGISYQLQLFHKNAQSYPYYSKGRALWKMTLLKAAAKYANPKKKYGYKIAGAILQFKSQQKIK